MRSTKILLWIFALALSNFASSRAQNQKSPAQLAAPANPANATTASDADRMFVFEGGTLNRFLDALEEQCKVKVRERATITVPGFSAIPKMRLRLSQGGDISELFTVYNRLSQQGFPEMGEWHWMGQMDAGLPEVLALAGRPDSAYVTKVRAFSMRGLSDKQRHALVDGIKEAGAIVEADTRSSQLPGGMRLNGATELLLVYGSQAFLEAADAVATEYRRSLLLREVLPEKGPSTGNPN